MGINWNVSDVEMALLDMIADRAVEMAKKHGKQYRKSDALMDIVACHANGCPLKLTELLGADDFNFAHDVFGINRHIDRSTGKIEDGFLPRFASL